MIVCWMCISWAVCSADGGAPSALSLVARPQKGKRAIGGSVDPMLAARCCPGAVRPGEGGGGCDGGGGGDGYSVPVRVRSGRWVRWSEGGRKCANGDAGDEAGDRWQWQHRAALRLVPKPHCLSLFNSGLALAALRFVPRLSCGPPPPPPGRVVPCAMHTAAAEARVSHVSRLCLRCAVLSGPGVKRLDGEDALRPLAHTCHINARGSTRNTAWLLAAEEAYRKRSGSPSMRGSRS